MPDCRLPGGNGLPLCRIGGGIPGRAIGNLN